MTDFTLIIPARYASTRFPAKALADIFGKPMIVRVAERAALSHARRIVVATDHEAIKAAVEAEGFEVIMTASDHATGTDRLSEAAEKLALPPEAVVVNVQGDEPLIDPALINAVAQQLIDHPNLAMATAACEIDQITNLWDPNVVKLVVNQAKEALYFGRAPIPWFRDHGAREATLPINQKSLPKGCPLLHHIGIYAYRAEFLRKFPTLPQAPIELAESLEQLRALWHGYAIGVYCSSAKPVTGVDSVEDLEKIRAIWPDFASA